MKMIYLAHPFGGKSENVEKVKQIAKDIILSVPGVTVYSPLNAIGYLYDDVDYDTGMEHCLEALKRCDEIWFCEGWENSKGCNIEMSFAKENNIPIVVW